MPELRYFTEAGRAQWREWLDQLQTDPAKAFPAELLTNPDCTRRAPGGSIVDARIFQTKMELAETLAPLVIALRSARFPAEHWPGLWDWLAALYFDSICSVTPSGKRQLRELARYLFNPDYKRRYRHRILGPVELYLRLGVYSRVLIFGVPFKVSDIEEQAASRNLTTSHVGIGEALDRLYWNSTAQAPKKGAAPNSRVPGTFRRFDDVLKQFDRTYDLLSISGEAILELLPREFAKFRR